MTLYPTCKVTVRHSAECKDRGKGSEWRKCHCRKTLLIYDPATKKNRRESTRTRSWEQAEIAAQDFLDQFDPVKRELKALKAVKELQDVKVEVALAAYTADMVTRLGNNKTVSRHQTILGYIDPETKLLRRNGRLFDWLATQNPRPEYIADFTPQHLTEFRNSWNFSSDKTTDSAWTILKTFFSFCVTQGWIQDSPARNIKRPRIAKGNRTCIFTDDQYSSILEAARGNSNRQVETFLELLRWSGMAPADAVQFRADSVDGKGVLRYQRTKTGELATIQLPEHVLALLRLEKGNQPFRQSNITVPSNVQNWRRELQAIFTEAGITEVITPMGKRRKPHMYMLRDSFAVWNLRHGMTLYDVAKLMGHSNPTITAKYYLPWCPELEEAHLAKHREALKQIPKARHDKVVNIA